MANIISPDKVIASLTLKEIPFSMAVLSDFQVALSTLAKVIYLLRVDKDITVTSRVGHTESTGASVAAKLTTRS
jgi:hypothetical protein